MKRRASIKAKPGGVPFDVWYQPAVISANNFKFKSLSNWALNIAVGCSHACRFCYVPSASTNWLKGPLAKYKVKDPDAQWGSYALLRDWDEEKFLESLAKAEQTPLDELKPDGNRAVIYCSTTDPYQVFPKNTKDLHKKCRHLVTQSLQHIFDKSSLNVRILTRSPMARADFDLFKKFKNRLAFGMSLPTLDNDLARIYEPKAPSPSSRLETLKLAVKKGLHVFVAMAPTYPECDEADLRRTMEAIRSLNPITVYHEPINIRSENVHRIKAHALELKKTMRSEVFTSKGTWYRYALESLQSVEALAHELGLADRLHLWPDEELLKLPKFLEMKRLTLDPSNQYTPYAIKRYEAQWQSEFEPVRKWIGQWHSRISEWPGKAGASRLVDTGSSQ